MPKGYVIFTEQVRDRAGLEAYLQKAVPIVLAAGGRPLVADDNPEPVEGEWHGNRTVVLEFDSVDAPRSWYRSAGDQAILGERQAATDSNVAIVSGFEMPAGAVPA